MIANSSRGTSLDVSELVKRMAFLRREFLGRNRFDAPQERGATNTIFFYDTDVIKTFCTPWEKGATHIIRRVFSEAAVGYGEPLPIESITPNASEEEADRDIQNIANRIAEMLAHHALTGVRRDGQHVGPDTKRLPLYQFPGHFGQTKGIFQNARHFAAQAGFKSVDRVNLEIMRRTMAYLHFTSREGDTGHQTLEILTTLIERMAGQDLPLWDSSQKRPTARQRVIEWSQFVQLNTDSGGLFRLDQAESHAKEIEAATLASALTGLDELEGIEKHIADLIRKAARQRNRSAEDAEAIAILYVLNRRLQWTAEKGQSTWRAVFVTGSTSIANFCYDLHNIGLPTDDEDSNRFTKTFSQRYVRHLFSYVPDAILDTQDESEARFHGLLDGALSFASNTVGFSQEKLTDLYRNPELTSEERRVFNDSRQELIDNWNTVCRQAVARDRFRSIGLNEREAEFLKARVMTIVSLHGKAGYETWPKLIDHAVEQYARSRDRTYLSYSNVGRHALLFRHDDDRNPPALWFDNLEKANVIFQKLCMAGNYPKEEFAKDYGVIDDDCANLDDPEDDRLASYTKYIVLGAAFASMNRWPIALAQGQNALAIVERSRKFGVPTARSRRSANGVTTSVTGREAHFLCAVAFRLSGRNSWDFDSAEKHLDGVEAAMEKEGHRQPCEDRRLVSERLALALSRYYAAREARERAQRAGTTRLEVTLLAEDLVNPIYDTARRAVAAFHEFELSAETDIRDRLAMVNLTTNILQTVTIQAFRRDRDIDETVRPVDRQTAEDALELLRVLVGPPKGQPSIRSSSLINNYMLVVNKLLNRNDIPGLKLDTESPDDHDPGYDGWRKAALASFVTRVEALTEDGRDRLLD